MGPSAIWAPWRLAYLEGVEKDPAPPSRAGAQAGATGGASGSTAQATFLAAYWADPTKDHEHHVIERTAQGMILLNGFPYAGGHLLVALGEGRPRLLDYSHEQRAALWALTDRAAWLMETALNPQGINIGINQGRAAGAGIPQHLHVHLVPRWNGDVNFITAVGGVRVIPSALFDMAERYRRAARGA